MTMLRFFCFTLVALCLPQGTRADMLPQIDIREEGSAWRVRVEATFSAPARQIWSVLTDCGRATAFVPHLESCRVMDHDPNGRWDIRENVSNPPLLPRMRTLVRSDYQAPRHFTYKLVSGDMKRSEGSWTLMPQPGGTQVVYVALIEPSLPAPGFLVANAIKADLPDMFRKLEALTRAP